MIGLITEGLKAIYGTIDKVLGNKKEATQLKNQIETQVINLFTKMAEYQSAVLQKEMSGNWLQRSWRPILMLVCIYIIFHNWILASYVRIFYPAFPIVDIPTQLWTLLHIGVGGYIGGRSIEKASGKIAEVLSRNGK